MSVTILYIDHDLGSQDIMRRVVEQNGHGKLIAFENSTAFASDVQNLNPTPDIIFLDIDSKPIDGFEMLKMLRQLPQYETVAIIAVTASVTNEEVLKLEESGFDGAIVKPLDYDVFPALLQDILEGTSVWYIG